MKKKKIGKRGKLSKKMRREKKRWGTQQKLTNNQKRRKKQGHKRGSLKTRGSLLLGKKKGGLNSLGLPA